MAEVVSKEQATKELNSWLTLQCISDEQKKSMEGNIYILVGAIQSGHLIIDDKKCLVQTLRFPFGAEIKVSQLKYKNELTVGEVQDHKAGIAKDDDLRETIGHLAAATGQPATVLRKMNTKDFNISAAAIPFFMV